MSLFSEKRACGHCGKKVRKPKSLGEFLCPYCQEPGPWATEDQIDAWAASEKQRRELATSLGSSLTPVEIEERAERLAERREKLDYFYISAFVAILVFTFNDFNSTNGALQMAPLWLVEMGWGSLIVAALCPLYVMGVRFERFAMNLDEIAGKKIDRSKFRALRHRGELVRRAMALFFFAGVVSLAIAYGLGLGKH
jgi:hypothetical protein